MCHHTNGVQYGTVGVLMTQIGVIGTQILHHVFKSIHYHINGVLSDTAVGVLYTQI